jgi:hypothetical protein
MCQSEHLGQIRQRALTTIVLPVGVGDETRGGIERQILGNGGLLRRIERKQRLKPQQRVQDQKPADVEQQHADCIHEPALLTPLIDSTRPIDPTLDRPQHRRQESPIAIENVRHVGAERLYQRDDDRAVERDLNPANDRHDDQPFRNARAGGARRRDRSASPVRRLRRANSRMS